MRKEIRRGNATEFSPQPLFAWQRLIAAGIVPKKDCDVWRFIKDFSEKKSSSSLNATAAKVAASWCDFATVFARFRRASGPDAAASSWDCTSAYPVFKIASYHRHMTTSFIPGHGFSHRLRGDMGLARSGYAWEILGGRLLSTLYFTLSFVSTVDADGLCTLDLCGLTDLVSSLPALSAHAPPSPAGFGAVSRELMLTDVALALLRSGVAARPGHGPTSVDLTEVSRWCDDFVSFAADHLLADRNDRAVVFVHRLCGFALAQDKFIPARDSQEFYGVTFDVRAGSVSMTKLKRDKLAARLREFRPGQKADLRSLQRLAGLLNFFGCAYPSMKMFSATTRQAVGQAGRICRRRGTPATTPTAPISADHARDLATWLRFLETAPSSVSNLLLSADEAVQVPDVVAHTDWSGAPGHGALAAVILEADPQRSTRYASGPMDPAFYQPVSSDAAAPSSPVGEATAVLALLSSFPACLRGRVVVCYTDSLTLVQRYYNPKRSSKYSEALQRRLEDIAVLSTTLNTRLILLHVPSHKCIADCLTRSAPMQARSATLRAKLLSAGLSPAHSQQLLSLPPSRFLPPRSPAA
jgi:hypothetical protein